MLRHLIFRPALALLMMSLVAVLPASGQNPPPEVIEGRGDFEMVLIHGLGSKAAVWDQTLPYLKRTFNVRVFELSGHGSTQPVMDPTIETETDRLEAFIAKEGLVYPTLVGHGMGGMIALTYSIRHPADVHRLILMDTAPKQLASAEEKTEVAKQLATNYDEFVASRFMNVSPDKDITDDLVDTALRTDSASFISLLMSSFDYDQTGGLYTLPVPMLIIGSELMFPAADSSQHLLEHYGFGSAKSLSFKRMGETGHFMMLERPVHTASVLLAFGVTAEYQFDR
jgi:pimeloyl-ACP methyl ester carboxylesterase